MNPKTMKVSELRKELIGRGLPVKGLKVTGVEIYERPEHCFGYYLL